MPPLPRGQVGRRQRATRPPPSKNGVPPKSAPWQWRTTPRSPRDGGPVRSRPIGGNHNRDHRHVIVARQPARARDRKSPPPGRLIRARVPLGRGVRVHRSQWAQGAEGGLSRDDEVRRGDLQRARDRSGGGPGVWRDGDREHPLSGQGPGQRARARRHRSGADGLCQARRRHGVRWRRSQPASPPSRAADANGARHRSYPRRGSVPGTGPGFAAPGGVRCQAPPSAFAGDWCLAPRREAREFRLARRGRAWHRTRACRIWGRPVPGTAPCLREGLVPGTRARSSRIQARETGACLAPGQSLPRLGRPVPGTAPCLREGSVPGTAFGLRGDWRLAPHPPPGQAGVKAVPGTRSGRRCREAPPRCWRRSGDEDRSAADADAAGAAVRAATSTPPAPTVPVRLRRPRATRSACARCRCSRIGVGLDPERRSHRECPGRCCPSWS